MVVVFEVKYTVTCNIIVFRRITLLISNLIANKTIEINQAMLWFCLNHDLVNKCFMYKITLHKTRKNEDCLLFIYLAKHLITRMLSPGPFG